MPFPWEKVKSTRISQLVNDHLHNSQKRRDGSSLVVETGFPTSLIDLFIKNREKLKKPSKKRRQNPPNTPISETDDPIIAGSPISFPSPSPPPPPSLAGSPTATHTPLRCPSPLHNLSVLPSPSGCVSEISVVGSSRGGTFVGVCEKEHGDETVADVNRVLLGVLKMFLVVVLALGTKRLAVGITISAFLLLFLEYVGKHASGLLKPCSTIVRSVRRLLRFKEIKLDEKKGGVLMAELQQEGSINPGCSSLRSSASRCTNQEIEVVDPKDLATHVEEIQPENKIMEESCFKERLGCQEIDLMEMEMVMEREESICDVAESKRKSRRAKIKSKMKKYVTKKFRSSRKQHDLQRPEIVKDESGVSYEVHVDQSDSDGESENAFELSSFSGGRFREEDITSEICACARLSEVSEEADMKREEKGHGIEAGLTWRHLALCLIVLIGLIGGRAFALVLTLSWFLLLKLGETLPRFMKSG